MAIIYWQQNFTKYIITPKAWQDEPTVLFRFSFVSPFMGNETQQIEWPKFSSERNKGNCASRRKRGGRRASTHEQFWPARLHSDSTSSGMFNSCASRKYGDKHVALRKTFCWLWHAQKPVDGWIEETQGYRWHILSGKWENTPLVIEYPALHSQIHCGCYRLGTGCSYNPHLLLIPEITSQMTAHLSFSCATVCSRQWDGTERGLCAESRG